MSRSCRIGLAVAGIAAVFAAAGSAATGVASGTAATGSAASRTVPTGSAATARAATQSVPACATRALVITVATNGAGGKVLIFVGLRNRGRHRCAVRGRASLALRDADTHALLHVYGNPYTRTLRSSLRRGPNTLFTLQWQNYCGPLTPLLVVASFGRRRAIEHDDTPGARCELPDVPSQLLVFHPPG